jgi:DNA-binding NarL/FixJ family response regulator
VTNGAVTVANALVSDAERGRRIHDARRGTIRNACGLSERAHRRERIVAGSAEKAVRRTLVLLLEQCAGVSVHAELIDAIRRAAAGGMAFAKRPGPAGAAVRLSERELDVVRLVVEGLSNDEIGAHLGIGAKTVESHLRRLFERFDIASRTELATRALREGWLDVPPGA